MRRFIDGLGGWMDGFMHGFKDLRWIRIRRSVVFYEQKGCKIKLPVFDSLSWSVYKVQFLF